MINKILNYLINTYHYLNVKNAPLYRPILVFSIVLPIVLSIWSLFFFLDNKIYLIGSDAFYYKSISDSILQFGEFQDITQKDPISVKTPQNGIVIIHLILTLIGISKYNLFPFIVFINYFFYLSAIYPLYKIFFIVSNNSQKKDVIPLIGVYLSAWHIYRINLLAINDGIFNSLIIWSVYFSIILVNSIESNKTYSTKIFEVIKFVILIGITSLFRVNIFFVILASIMALIFTKRFKTLKYFSIFPILLLTIFWIMFSVIDIRAFEKTDFLTRVSNIILQPEGFNQLTRLLSNILPRVIFGSWGISSRIFKIIIIVFPLSMIYYGIRGIRLNHYPKVLISSLCILSLWFTFSFPNARVIWYIFPFVYLIVFTIKEIRLFGYIFYFFVIIQTFQEFHIGYNRMPESELFLHIYENKIELSEKNSMLLTRKARHSYFLFDKRAYRISDDVDGIIDGKIPIPNSLKRDLFNNSRPLYILGDSTYISHSYNSLFSIDSISTKNLHISSVTPNLSKFSGWSLVLMK